MIAFATGRFGDSEFHERHLGWAGRPQGISFSGRRTRTPRTPKTPKTVAGWACARSHWPARSHWDNGRPARCMDCPWPVNATRKIRIVPVGLFPARSTRQALSWESWVSWVSWPRRGSREAAKRLPRHGPPPRWRRSQSKPCAKPLTGKAAF